MLNASIVGFLFIESFFESYVFVLLKFLCETYSFAELGLGFSGTECFTKNKKFNLSFCMVKIVIQRTSDPLVFITLANVWIFESNRYFLIPLSSCSLLLSSTGGIPKLKVEFKLISLFSSPYLEMLLHLIMLKVTELFEFYWMLFCHPSLV